VFIFTSPWFMKKNPFHHQTVKNKDNTYWLWALKMIALS